MVDKLAFKKWDELSPEEQARISAAAQSIQGQIDERQKRSPEEIEDEENTPARRQFDPLFNQVFDLIFTPADDDVALSSMERLQAAAALLFRSGSEEDAGLIRKAFLRFAEAVEGDEDRDFALRHGLTMLLLAALGSRIDMVYAIADQQKSKMKGLKSKARAVQRLIDRAREIAAQRWEADHLQEIRIGAMADLVYRQLAQEFGQAHLPELPETVKDWIKPVAPEYARRGGRAKKSSRT